MSQGGNAVKNGAKFEEKMKGVLEEIFGEDIYFLPTEYYSPVHKKGKGYSDLLISYKNKKIRFECKSKTVSGSDWNKLYYVVHCCDVGRFNEDTYLILNGDRWQKDHPGLFNDIETKLQDINERNGNYGYRIFMFNDDLVNHLKEVKEEVDEE